MSICFEDIFSLITFKCRSADTYTANLKRNDCHSALYNLILKKLKSLYDDENTNNKITKLPLSYLFHLLSLLLFICRFEHDVNLKKFHTF
jgi:hypothetical protein